MEITGIMETTKFEDLLTKRIYDDVHGFVALTEDEKTLLSHPYMKRLHFIKQNALANFVFPGATHTRFSHSIGVLHIVEKMIQKLKTLPKNKIDIKPIDHQIVRLAALLHDVGHYPLSHTIEDCFQKYDQYFLRKPQGINALTSEPNSKQKEFTFDKLKNLKDVLRDFPEISSNESEFHHEKIAKKLITDKNSPLSCFVASIIRDSYKRLYKQNLDTETLNSYLAIIGDLICGNLNYTENKILKDSIENKEKYFLLSLLINSDLDADQMDYMLRDTKNTGIQTTIRLDFLIDNLEICYIKIDNYHQPVLCFKYKALESVQQFIFSKAYWYTEIILYDKVCILNKIAKRLYLYYLYIEKNINSIEDFCTKIAFKQEEYIKYTDAEFWNAINKIRDNKETPKIILNLTDILLGFKKMPEPYTDETIEKIEKECERKCFKTNISSNKYDEKEKNNIYDTVNKYFNDTSKLPFYFSSKFFKPTHGESGYELFANRSIYILKDSCNKKCDKNCPKAYELLDAKNIGLNIIHRVLEINTDTRNNAVKQAYNDKFVIYQFEDLY